MFLWINERSRVHLNVNACRWYLSHHQDEWSTINDFQSYMLDRVCHFVNSFCCWEYEISWVWHQNFEEASIKQKQRLDIATISCSSQWTSKHEDTNQWICLQELNIIFWWFFLIIVSTDLTCCSSSLFHDKWSSISKRHFSTEQFRFQNRAAMMTWILFSRVRERISWVTLKILWS